MAEPHGHTARIAIGLAVAAVVIVVVAVIIVATREGPKPAQAASKPDVSTRETGSASYSVLATDVVRIDRGTVDPVTDPTGPLGIRISDAELLDVLSLEKSDVITAISGKPIRRQFDVYDALLGASMMNATALYVELVRDGKPLLVKWEIEGDLREARSGTRPAHVPRVPPTPLAPDPLADTIKKIDELNYEVPRSTIEQVATNVMSGMTYGVRFVPAMRNGQPDGIKAYAIRPGSVWLALGLKNGDTIQVVNSRTVTSSNAQEHYDRLRSENELRVELMRRGQAVTVKLTIK